MSAGHGAWLEELAGVHPQREFRVYGNHVFGFQPEPGTGWQFITVLRVPRELLRSWHRLCGGTATFVGGSQG